MRWYDNDPILKEALELLQLQPDETKCEAANFMLKLQEEVAADVIERVYEIIEFVRNLFAKDVQIEHLQRFHF